MTDDPIVEEVHAIRSELLAQHCGDLRALLRDAQRRTEQAAQAGRMVVTGRPRPPRPAPLVTKTAG
jgi:hypothetical protein